MTILSVLDQSPIRAGATPADAVADTAQNGVEAIVGTAGKMANEMLELWERREEILAMFKAFLEHRIATEASA